MSIVELERHGAVAVVTLNRPEVRNAFDGPMARALGAAIDEVEADPGLRAAVLTATITEPRPVFCAGHDLRTIEDEFAGGDQAMTERGGFAGFVTYRRTKPVVAAVDGLATSGGLEIVLACDLVVASRRSSFALAEVRWNLVAGAGGLFRLPWAVGRAAAMDMLLTGDAIDAERAHQLGLVSALVDTDPTAAALARAERIAGNGPLAVSASMRVCDRAFSDSEAELWAANDAALESIAGSEDLEAGLAAFAGRSTPTFLGR
ncbi:enoyl-CoA hydratase-related protein [Nocardioides sp. LHD-245]|uniref:enoyl-CoA hydratase-related protein n=1 Tax=Nocardioides sp. LHD-245 TaxID=3051387 RepID=UPI0027DFD3E2|nr:enoyl-CoA hydratase-related protein [Nocardioides sp. LHD-245]